MPLGTAIAILVEDEADLAAFKDYKGDGGSAPTSAPVSSPAAESTPSAGPAASKTYPDHVKLEMPNLSPTMEKVSIF